MNPVLSQATIDRLRQIASGSAVSHCYLLTGPAGSFRNDAIQAFEQLLHCSHKSGCGTCIPCKLLQTDNDPDTITLIADGASIKIDAIRDMLDRIKYGPTSNSFFTVKIPDAQTLTPQAANALLKTLESPPERVIFLLGAPSRAAVLTTITSRSQVIPCAISSPEQITAYLASIGFAHNDTWQAAPNAALMASKSGAKLPDWVPTLDDVLNAPPAQRIILTHPLGKSKDLVLICMVKWIEELWQTVQKKPADPAVSQTIRRLDLLVENILQLRYNLNPRLHLDQILLSL